MNVHKNAKLTPRGRAEIVHRVIQPEASGAAASSPTSRSTASRWRRCRSRKGTAAPTTEDGAAVGASDAIHAAGPRSANPNIAPAASFQQEAIAMKTMACLALAAMLVGASHEGAVGTLERIDLTAAFGASR